MKKRIISILLTLCMMTTLLPTETLATGNRTGQETLSTPISAAEVENDEGNSTESNVSNEKEDGLLGIANDSISTQSSDTDIAYPVTGGNIYFDAKSGTITDCDESATIAVIPNIINGVTVTEIGYKAFEACSNLTNITIPDGVTTINPRTFSGCRNLTNITIPNNVTIIYDAAFSECTNLTSIIIPDGVTKIGNSVFYNCSSLSDIIIPNSVTNIGNSAFSNCTGLTNITMPDSAVDIGASTFWECTSLTSIIIPDGITSIRFNTFFNCNSLTKVVIPNSVADIGANAFSHCSSLMSIKIPDGVTAIGSNAFDECSQLKSITIPDSVSTIGSDIYGAFHKCDCLTDVYYGGSENQWKAISFGLYDDCFTSATIHYNSTGPENSNTFTEIHQLKSWDVFTNTVYFHDGTSYLRVSEDAVDLDSLLNCWVTCTLRNSDTGVLLVSMEKLEAKTETVIKTLKAYDVFTNTVYFTDDTSYPLGENVSIDLDNLLNAQVTCTIESDPIKGIYLTSIVKYSDEFQNHIVRIDWSDLENVYLQRNLTIDIYFDQELNKDATNSSLGTFQILSKTGAVIRTIFSIINVDAQSINDYAYYEVDPSDLTHLIIAIENTASSAWNQNCQAIPYDSILYLTMSTDAIIFADPNITLDGISFQDAKNNNSLSVITKWGMTADIDFLPFTNSRDSNDLFCGFADEHHGMTTTVENLLLSYCLPRSDSYHKIQNRIHLDEWNGSCQGMVSVMALDKMNAINLSSWDKTADTSYNLTKPKCSTDEFGTQDLINYYHLLQYLKEYPERQAHKNGFWLSDWLLDYEDWDNAIRHITDIVKSSQTIKKPLLIGMKLEAGCHMCLAYACVEDETKYRIYLYDPTYPTIETFLEITKDSYDVTLNGGWPDSTLNVISYVDPSDLIQYTLDDQAQAHGVTESIGGNIGNYAILYFDIAENCVITNAAGEYLRYENGEFSGTMKLYSLRTVGTGGISSPEYRIEVDKSTQFVYTSIGRKTDFTVYQNGYYFETEASSAGVTVTAFPEKSVVLSALGEINYRILTSVDLDGADMVAISGQSTGPITAHYAESGQVQLSAGDVSTAKVTIFDGSNVTESQVDTSGVDPVIAAEVCVSGVSISNNSLTLTVGESIALTAEVEPSDASNPNLIWMSSNNDIATVNDKGVVTAVGAGSATITVTTLDGGYTAHCMVTVNAASQLPMGQHTISFNPNGGTTSSIAEVTDSNGKLSSLPTATRINHTFTGWYTSPTGGEQITTDTIFGGDATVYAHWIYSGGNNDRPTDSDWAPSGNDSSQSAFSITSPSTSHGTVTITPKSAAKGSTVTITAIPDPDYKLASLTVTDSKGNELGLTDKGDGKYTFTMPGSAATVNATFEPVEQMSGATPESNWVNPYTDVSTSAWYYDAVKFASENSLMNGIGNNLFAPDTNLSRAQLTQILYNKEGKPTSSGNSIYTDVSNSTWYTAAIAWASGNSVVEGYGNNLFGPNDSITREQLAVMLWRYAGKPTANRELPFNDASQISSYALPAMRWAVDNGILNGKGNGILDPKGFATRAQVAQMFTNSRLKKQKYA